MVSNGKIHSILYLWYALNLLEHTSKRSSELLKPTRAAEDGHARKAWTPLVCRRAGVRPVRFSVTCHAFERSFGSLGKNIRTLNATSTALKALRRMRFVGITEQWDTSICLWHLQFPSFGTRCLPVEMRNVRPSRDGCAAPTSRRAPSRAQCEHAREQVKHIRRTPNALRDEEDEQVYEEALRIFNERVERYGASRQRCLEMGCTSTFSTSREKAKS